MIRSKPVALFIFLALLGGLNAAAAESPVALVKAGNGLLEWIPLVEAESATLTLADPLGDTRTFRFGPGTPPALSLFDAEGAPLPDGSYTWELRTAKGAQSGSFTIAEGSLVSPDLAEQPRLITAADQVVPDDLIVDGKSCIGLGCANNETFGTETLRLKQGVVRLRFQDTSTGLFPGSDWQVTANDSASGGANRFSIEDLTAATTPLTIVGGAPSNSVYVDNAGRIGFGTATPGARIHLLENADVNTIVTAENPNTGVNALGALRARSDTATVNFQAHGSGRTIARFGQTLASWAEFLQVTGNGLIIGTVVDKPFILGTNSANRVHIAADGNIGVGTASPSQPLHLSRSNGTAKVLVEETSGTAASRELLELKNSGGPALILDDTNDATRWSTAALGSQYLINNQANAGVEVTITSTGSMTIAGTLTQLSDRTMKEAIVPVQPEEVLEKLASLPISTWSRKDEDPKVRHLGPMAQDFSAIFGLGEDDRHIAPLDMAGVSMASIQALNGKVAREMAEKDAEIAALRQRLADLEELVAKLAAAQ